MFIIKYQDHCLKSVSSHWNLWTPIGVLPFKLLSNDTWCWTQPYSKLTNLFIYVKIAWKLFIASYFDQNFKSLSLWPCHCGHWTVWTGACEGTGCKFEPWHCWINIISHHSHVHRASITQALPGFSGYIWLDTKTVLKKMTEPTQEINAKSHNWQTCDSVMFVSFIPSIFRLSSSSSTWKSKKTFLWVKEENSLLKQNLFSPNLEVVHRKTSLCFRFP